ncbi:MAG: DUF4271 domain-containing protein [Bacteroidales bacterium]|jgi:hypothetical protein|nr:DUF4271 domain-containing protein [Bacteroidales bacterium]
MYGVNNPLCYPTSGGKFGEMEGITLLLLLIFVLISILCFFYRQRYFLQLTALFSRRNFSQLLVKRNRYLDPMSVIGSLVYGLGQSLFCYLVLKYFFPRIFALQSPYILYLFILGVVMFDFFVKNALLRWHCFLYDMSWKSIPEQYCKTSYRFASGTCLFVLLVLALYTGYPLILGLYLPFLGVLFIAKAIKLFKLNSMKRHPFHFFVYLCTLEILPYFVGIKVLLIFDKQLV